MYAALIPLAIGLVRELIPVIRTEIQRGRTDSQIAIMVSIRIKRRLVEKAHDELAELMRR